MYFYLFVNDSTASNLQTVQLTRFKFIWNPITQLFHYEFTHFSPKWKKEQYLTSQLQALLIPNPAEISI